MNHLFKNGSKWYRADFHLHTRADTGEFPYYGAENNFVNDYVDKLMEQHIRIGFIKKNISFYFHIAKIISIFTENFLQVFCRYPLERYKWYPLERYKIQMASFHRNKQSCKATDDLIPFLSYFE